MKHLSTKDTKNYALDTSSFVPKTQEDECALELALTLKDTNNFAYYRFMTKHVSIWHLKQTLKIVMDIPDEKITKSRAALFTTIIKRQHLNRN